MHRLILIDCINYLSYLSIGYETEQNIYKRLLDTIVFRWWVGIIREKKRRISDYCNHYEE